MSINRKDKKYKELIISNSLEEDELKNIGSGNQISFPFSSAVPVVCNLIKVFLGQIHDFSRYSKKPEHQVSSTIERLLMEMSNCIVLCMEESYSHSNVAQLVQIHQNLSQFSKFIKIVVGEILLGFRYSKWIVKQTLSPVLDAFKSAHENAEDMITKLCKDKFSAFFSLSLNINWNSSNPRKDAHENIHDFGIYLGAIHQMLKPLDNELQDILLTRIHSNIGSKFLLLLSDEVSSFNINAVKDIQTDLNYLISIASDKHHKKSSTEGLKEILQTISLLGNSSPSIYLDKKEREKQYPSISPETLDRILQK